MYKLLLLLLLLLFIQPQVALALDKSTVALHSVHGVYDGANVKRYDLRTVNFRLIFDTADQRVQEMVAQEAEAAFTYLGSKFATHPREKIEITIDTRNSGYSGYTDILERKIFLSLGAPMEMEYYGAPYIRMLLRHELVHYFTGHRVETLPWGTGRGIGWMLMPMWLHEGISEFYSSPWDTISDVFSRNAFLYGEINREDMSVFYYANALGRRLGYNLGFSLVRFISEKFGEKKLHAIFTHVRTWNPRFHHILKKVMGESASAISKQWRNERQKYYQHQVLGRTVCDGKKISTTKAGSVALNPVYTRDGKFLYYTENDHSDYFSFSLIKQELATGKRTKLLGNLNYRFALAPSNKFLVFSRRSRYALERRVSDLYLYDVKTGKTRRLTRGRQGENPAISPDEKTIVYTANQDCRQELFQIDLASGKEKKRLSLQCGEAVYSPIFSNDGRFVYFTRRTQAGQSSLEKLNNQDELTVLRQSKYVMLRPMPLQLSGQAEGLAVLYGDGHFLDLGILFENSHSLKPITRLSTGVIDYALSPDGTKLIISEIRSGQIVLVSFDCHKLHILSEDSSAVNNQLLPQAEFMPKVTGKLQSGYDGMPEFRYLIPWMDTMGGNPMLGFRTKLSDPVGHNELEVMSLWGDKGYHSKELRFSLTGMNPIFGVKLYDVADEFRPSQNRSLKGGDVFATWQKDSRLSVTAALFKRKNSSNSISPYYALRNPATGDVQGREAGFYSSLLYANAQPAVDSDIRPLNLSLFNVHFQRTSVTMGSFFDYRLTRALWQRSFQLSDHRHQLGLKLHYGQASGQFDFQFGGPDEIRGYRSSPRIGQKVRGITLEYQLPVYPKNFITEYLSLMSIYPAIFYDRAEVYTNQSKTWQSVGVEFSSRILILNKLPLEAKYGVARTLGNNPDTEIYSKMILRF